MRLPLLLLCLLGALGLFAAPAVAATTISTSGSEIDVVADAGVANDISVAPGATPDAVRIRDAAAAVSPGPGCTADPLDPGVAECALPGSVHVSLGDGGDSLTAANSPVPVAADGGDGDDRITGSPLADTLTGGEGRDTFHARDNATDTVDCGPGADDAGDADPADGDPHDTLTACEETPATAGAPDTLVLSGPGRATRSTAAAFRFSATEPDASFECALDGAAFTDCAGSPTFPGLAAGAHRLEVRAVDLVGNRDAAPEPYEWIVDTQQPGVTLTARPDASTNETAADFAFTVDETAATAECRLDGGAWTDCRVASAAHYAGLEEGAHAFAVRVTDAAGNAGSASHDWVVDRTAPHASFTARPAPVTPDATPAFGVSMSELATVECSLDGAAFVGCSASPAYSAAVGYSGLADGAHDLKVRSTDPAGNGTVIAAAWTQDTVRPQTQLTAGPATSAPVNSSQATLTFASADAVRFECSLDDAAWAACASPVTYRGLPNGAHSFAVRAVDAAGNVDGTPATRAWTVRVAGAPTARIAVTRDADGFVLDAGASADPERGALIYRWQRNGEPAGATATVRYAAPDQAARDVFVVTVTDRTGLQGRATVALRTRASQESAAHETVEVIRFSSGTRLATGARARIAALRGIVPSASEVRIEGYARGSGDAARLSKARAQKVRGLLVKGVQAPANVTVLGRGAASAAASNVTAAGRARNDRVVVTVGYDALAQRLVTEQEGNSSVRRSTAPQPVAAAGGRAPKLFAFYSAVPGALRRLQEVGARVDVLAPNWYSLSPGTGAVRGGKPNAKVMALSRKLRFDVWPVVNATMNGSQLIDTAGGRAKVVKRIAALAARHRLAGVTLDMEEMQPRQKDAYSALVAQLASELHRKHRKLAVYAVRRTDAEVTDSAAAYDWPALARAADLVLASGYNEHAANGTPGPITTQAGFDRLARYAASVSRDRVAPTLGAFGYQWAGGSGRMVSSADAERRWPVRAEVGSADGRAQVDGSARTWFESAEDLWAREQAARRAGAQWIGLFTLGREPERFWERSAIR